MLRHTTKMKPNPLNYFGIRKLDFPGEHLSCMEIAPQYNLEKAIETWIRKNCKSRYYIGKSITVESDNSIQNKMKIGFEDAKELSYFALACPHLKYK